MPLLLSAFSRPTKTPTRPWAALNCIYKAYQQCQAVSLLHTGCLQHDEIFKQSVIKVAIIDLSAQLMSLLWRSAATSKRILRAETWQSILRILWPIRTRLSCFGILPPVTCLHNFHPLTWGHADQALYLVLCLKQLVHCRVLLNAQAVLPVHIRASKGQ